jgi:hypothetical protein
MKTKICSLLLLAAALLVTGCRIVVDTDIKADGSGEFRSAVVFSAQEKDNFEQKPENESKSICDDIQKDVPAGARFVEEVHDGETFCVTERSFNNLSELRTFYAGMGQVTVNKLGFEFGKLILDVDVDLSNDQDGEGLEHEWRLTLPGEIGTQNADRVEGQTLIWVISPGEKDNLHAESQAGFSPATLGMVVIVLAVVAIVAVFLLLRRRR